MESVYLKASLRNYGHFWRCFIKTVIFFYAYSKKYADYISSIFLSRSLPLFLWQTKIIFLWFMAQNGKLDIILSRLRRPFWREHTFDFELLLKQWELLIIIVNGL